MNRLNRKQNCSRLCLYNRYLQLILLSKAKLLMTGILLTISTVLLAQKPYKESFEPIVCPAHEHDMHTRIPLKTDLFKSRSSHAVTQTAEFIVTFGPGALANPEAQAAFQFAIDIWATEIVSSVPIRVFAEFATLGPGVLASAGPTYLIGDFVGAPEPGVLYPAGLANALAGVDLDTEEPFDLVVNLGNSIPWYFGLDGNTPAGQFDFATIALHELGHGLGFLGVSNVAGGQGTIRSNGLPSIYSLFVVNGDDVDLTTFSDPSAELGNQLTGGDLFVNGSFAVAGLGGTQPELFAPFPYQGGSSYSHWDEATFPAGDPNSLMTPQAGSAESIFDIGDATRGFFRDMGWVLNDADAPAFLAVPGNITNTLLLDESSLDTVRLSNVSSFNSTAFEVNIPLEASWLSINPSNGSLNSGEAIDLLFTIDATGLAKGTFETTVTINSDSTETVTEVAVTLTVLDGTERPVISVSPNVLSQTLTQGETATQPLLVINEGDAELSFDVALENLLGGTFTANAALTKQHVLTNGFKSKKFKKGDGISSSFTAKSAKMNMITTSLYATDFEEFALGELDGQLGWVSQFPGNFTISTANSLTGTQHFRSESDGLGGTRPAAVLAFSPVVAQGSQAFSVASASLSIEGTGTTWEVIPQSPTEESVITRIRFNADRSISILSSDTGDFVDIDTPTPDGYFNLRVSVDGENSVFRVFFDGVEVFSATGFAPKIEQFVVLTGMEEVGSTFDMENVEITDGDDEAPFITASPLSGTVGIGDTAIVSVRFDARSLETGVFSADINISSNDPDNGLITVPTTLTVVSPPSISISPDSLFASVDVQLADPAIVFDTIVVSNTGDSQLEFSTSLEATTVTLLNGALNQSQLSQPIDLRLYGLGNTGQFEENSITASAIPQLNEGTAGNTNNNTFADSISYDSGINFPSDFAGLTTTAYTTGIKFVVEQPSFNLTAVRNAYSTEAVTNPVIIMEIYQGGATPADGILLQSQTIDIASTDGIFLLTQLATPINFSQGDEFWVVHKYPDGIAFPQGIDDVATQRSDTYFFSGDAGTTYNPSGFVFLTRALSGDVSSDSYLTIEPSSGNVNPGESINLLVSFDGEELGNGIYNTDISIASNDPNSPTVAVPTEFTVTGQTAEIAVSDQFLIFGSVFLGASSELDFTIVNEGLGTLDISSITSDNPDFEVSPETTVVGPSDSLNVTVTYTPSSLGNSNGILTINSSDTDEPITLLIVVGIGTAPPVIVLNPETVVETVDAGESINSEITVRNEGDFPLIFSLPEFTAASILANPSFVGNNTTKIDFGIFDTQKGTADNRLGHLISNSVGTDLGFGYTWIDSDEIGGPVFNFNDISATGTEISTTLGDDGSLELTLPFIFEFYGDQKSSLWVNSNGFISFEQPSGPTFINDQIPDPTGTNDLIAALWDDLSPQNFDGTIHHQAFADRFIIQWTNVSRFAGTDDESVTFQIVLMDNGNIDIFYLDVETAPFLNQATVGIENADGTDGAQVVFNAPYIRDNLALRFIRPAFALTSFITDASPRNGVIPAGGELSLSVTLDATDLNDGQFFDELNVSSNDPVTPNATGLFDLTVVGFPEIVVDQDSLTFDPIFIGLQSEQTLQISNTGTKTLEISSINSFNPDFTLSNNGPVSILPNESIDITVTFAPSTAGVIGDLITIASDDSFGNEFLPVFLFGTGIAPPIIEVAPDSISAVVYETESITDSLVITNTGVADLIYSLTPPTFGTAQSLLTQNQYEYIDYPIITDKLTIDNRVGPTVLNASGGPGTFGYSWVDSNSGGTPFNFNDISTTGTQANVGADGNEKVALPFDFNFFGIDNDSVYIGANGFLSFSELIGSNFVNQQIPNSSNPNFIIAGLWDDLEPQDGTGVFYETVGNQFIVQYEAVPGFGFGTPPAPVTFQIILNDDGSILLQYANVNSTVATSSTIGVEGPNGVEGLQILFNTAFLEDELAITITPPVTGVLAAGESDVISYTLDAATLAPGNFQSDFIFSSNDPVAPVLLVPVSLEVLNLPDVISFNLIDAETDVIIDVLEEGDVINLDNYPSNSFNIQAITNPETVGSVIFDFNGSQRFRRDNSAPYTIAGERRGGTDFRSMELPLGNNMVTASAFTRRNGNGKSGTPLTVNFEVINTNGDVCYGDQVLSYTPGNRKNGNTLPEIRTNSSNALGAPQENDAYNFVSLGFGGSIEIQLACEVFDLEGDDLLIVETSFRDAGLSCETYPETAMIEASVDGSNWVIIADEICKDGSVDLANGGLASAQFIRITDTSNAFDFRSGNADGYDVDGIVVLNNMMPDTASSTVSEFTEMANIVANEDAIVSAYPNPVENELRISLDNNEDKKINIQIFGYNGGVVYQQAMDVKSGVTFETINIQKLQRGIYHMVVTDENADIVSTMKVLKM